MSKSKTVMWYLVVEPSNHDFERGFDALRTRYSEDGTAELSNKCIYRFEFNTKKERTEFQKELLAKFEPLGISRYRMIEE